MLNKGYSVELLGLRRIQKPTNSTYAFCKVTVNFFWRIEVILTSRRSLKRLNNHAST